MRTLTPLADPTALLPDVPPARIPRHIAVIMDGNGRWAAERGFPRAFGHRMGARATRALLDAAERIGIEALTLYSFSAENWKRPADEIEQLMLLYVAYMDGERDALVRRNIRFRQIGRREGLPQDALDALDRTLDATASCTGPTLCLAINYSARQELADAAQRLAERASAGTLDPRDITEDTLERELDTAGLPDPDLLVRTAGELRLSNFLLWQLSYAELYVTNTLWPDFDAGSLHTAVRAFASRQRRYGGLDTEPATGVTDHHDPPSYNGTQ
ncbi:MAG: polyprenyl diphosphate synthase [Planctomycetota bacterium]